MSKRKILLLFFLLFIVLNVGAQNLRGKVFAIENGKKTPLAGANVFFKKNANGVATNEKGAFTITRNDDDSEWLYASYLGYSPDSLRITGDKDNIEFILSEGVELKEVTVVSAQKGMIFNRLDIGKTELITKTGLAKMACCNLSESFENSATVTVGFTDAVSGVKQVQLLGLSGLYSQLLTENVPMHKGLLSTFGWSYVPGSWLESIQISKGASSVVNGYESVSGQINVEMKKPNYTEPLFINLYADRQGRYEANVTSAAKVTKDLYTGLLLHGSADAGAHDYNGDTFLDMPESKFINLFNRWFYLSDKGIQSRTGLRLLADSRDAGQTEHLHSANAETGHGELYKSSIRNKGFSVENKTGFTIGGEGKSIGVITSFNYSDENLIYGRKSFNGRQNSFYSNVLYTSTTDSNHHYTIGASFAYDKYNTWYEDVLPFSLTPRTDVDRRETVPGVFAEYAYNLEDKLTFIIGLREDYNSRYGWLFTPRANIRYNPLKDLALRASVGRGYRSPNVIADNIGLLATSRLFDVAAIDNLDIERAWNFGGNITAYIPVLDEKQLTISLDYFHTQFDNQAIIDIERNRNSVFFYNLQGKSYADAMQVDISFSPFKGFDFFAAYRYNKTEITYSENGQNYAFEKPLTSRYRGLVNLAYATSLRKWVFDFTAQINGPSRIPGLNGYNSEKRYSEAYPVYFAQITKNTKRFDIYIGGENLLDFRQKDPIFNPEAPFGQDFDAYSRVWGPILGRRIYAGIRWRIGKLP
ncbi:MAG: TonB-dependent receptor [Dysgonamonadaceae bacterium]|nr:TonB-dependent receptor [Dysgonamonadaceae bacterium]